MAFALLGAVALAAAGYGLVVAAAMVLEPVYLYDADTQQGDPDVPGADVQVVELRSRDGETLVGWYLPPQPDRPVMLFLDGRSGALVDQSWRFRRLAKAGVGALSIAYRGFSGSTGRPSEVGLLLDAEAAYDWLRVRHPTEKLAIHGVSLGSGVAVQLAARRPADALILEAPFTSAVDMARHRAPLLPMDRLMRDRFMSSEHIGQVAAPVLIVHGDHDSVIPVEQGEQLYAMANPPKRFVRMAGGDHLTLVRQGLYDHVWRFLDVPFDETTAFSEAARASARVLSEDGDQAAARQSTGSDQVRASSQRASSSP